MTRHVCPKCGAAVLAASTEPMACAACRVRLEPADRPPTLPRRLDGVPVGIPALLSPSSAAYALGLSEGTLRGRLDRGEIECRQAGPGRRRYVLTTELVAYERRGYPVDWDRLAALYDQAA